MSASYAVERAALQLVPPRDRDAVLGDLGEEGIVGTGRLAAILSVGGAYQCEPWRDDRTRVGILALFAAGLILLRLLPIVAGAMDFLELDGAVWRGAARFWANGLAIAATAAGLLVGRAPLIPEYASSARWHVAVVLAVATLLSAPAWAEGLLATALLLAGALVGSAARNAPAPPAPA